MIADLIVRWLGPALERAGYSPIRAATREEAKLIAQVAFDQARAAMKQAGFTGIGPSAPGQLGKDDPDAPVLQ